MYIQRTYIDPFILNKLNYTAYEFRNSETDISNLEYTDYNDTVSNLEIKNKLTAKLFLGKNAIDMRRDLQKKISNIILSVEEELHNQ
jgi:hypothetical protein